jgi:catechol 2,3-dioxygenase-like lactoylglutathione lyase family enzyme
MRIFCSGIRALSIVALSIVTTASNQAVAQTTTVSSTSSMPRLHHVGLNSVDPDRAIEWYLKLWPTAKKTTFAGFPAVQSDMMLLFNKVDRAPEGGWRNDLHRGVPQSPFWHIGAFINSTDLAERLKPLGIVHLPLYLAPNDTVHTTWRAGLAPYAGNLTASQITQAMKAEPTPPRDGGFSYVLAPEGVLFELTGGADTKPSFSHIHFFHEHPQCAANWFVKNLGMELPPTRSANGTETPRTPIEPCETKSGEATWPALEPIGTIRSPAGTVRYANGSMAWYPRQCVGDRCGKDQPFVHSRGQLLDHVAFSVDDFDALFQRLSSSGVTVLERPHAFGETRAFMIEDPDGLAIELVDARPLGTNRP